MHRTSKTCHCSHRVCVCVRACVGVRVLVRVHVDKDGLWNVQKRKEFWKIKKVRSASVTDIRQKVSQSAV